MLDLTQWVPLNQVKAPTLSAISGMHFYLYIIEYTINNLQWLLAWAFIHVLYRCSQMFGISKWCVFITVIYEWKTENKNWWHTQFVKFYMCTSCNTEGNLDDTMFQSKQCYFVRLLFTWMSLEAQEVTSSNKTVQLCWNCSEWKVSILTAWRGGPNVIAPWFNTTRLSCL
jgi:hypothetical protein